MYKSILKLKQSPKNVRFDQLRRVLEDSGFSVRQPGKGSSHYIFHRKEKVLVVPYKRPFVKAYYVKKALKLIEGE